MSHVAVLKGGRSLERQVSLRSGARVEDSLERLGHQVTGVDVGTDLVPRLIELEPDIAFVALHGRDGEDGTVQELLDVLGLAHTGSRAAACALAAHKITAKRVFRRAGIPTAEFLALREDAFGDLGAGRALGHLEARLAFPVVVKPARSGSALGIKFVHAAAGLPTALIAAFSYDRDVLLERFIDGRDLAVGIIAGADGEPEALPVVEALPDNPGGGAGYDYESRYEIGRTRFTCPAELDPELSREAERVALAAYRELGCAGFARVDLMLDSGQGELLVLEVNPIPGLTETSLLPIAADAAGLGFDELVERILAAAPA